jgi:hypothetical protein
MIDAGIGANSASGGYNIENSYKNENDNTERMYRAWGGITANTRTWTVSLWVKRTELGASLVWGAGVSGNDVLVVDFDSSDRLGFRSTKDTADDCVYLTNRVFRDTSAWYHLVFAVDTTSGTAGNRLRIYVNGVEETSFATETNFDQNDLTLHNANGSYMEVGSVIGESPRFNGYIAEVNSITGTQYAPTAFGKFDDDSGIWIPILFAGSYAENSVFLEFKDSSSLGTDTSGNGQTFTLQNLSAADQSTDTPTNNFCTYNSTMYMFETYNFVTEGATKTSKLYQNWITPMPTIGVSRGKWYAEFEFVNTGIDSMIGVVPMGEPGFEGSGVTNSNSYLGQSTNSIGYYGQQGNKYNNASGSSYGSSYVAGDKMAVALDMDNGKVYFAKNGTWQNSGVPTSGATGTGAINLIQPTETHGIASSIWANNSACLANYGGYTTISISSAETDENGYGTFEYAPPTGYYALCTKNLAEFG